MKKNDVSNKSAGKGDKPRPVNKKTYDVNYSKINWGKPSELDLNKHIQLK